MADNETKIVKIELKPVSKPMMWILKAWGYCALGVIALFGLSFVIMVLSVFWSAIF